MKANRDQYCKFCCNTTCLKLQPDYVALFQAQKAVCTCLFAPSRLKRMSPAQHVQICPLTEYLKSRINILPDNFTAAVLRKNLFCSFGLGSRRQHQKAHSDQLLICFDQQLAQHIAVKIEKNPTRCSNTFQFKSCFNLQLVGTRLQYFNEALQCNDMGNTLLF